MKLFHKIFLFFVVIFSITFQTAGLLLVNFSYENALEQEKKYAIQEFQYNKYSLQSLMVLGKEILNDNLTVSPVLEFTETKQENMYYQMYQSGEENYIFVYGSINQNDKTVYLVTETNISKVVDEQREMLTYFQKIFLLLLLIAFPIIFLLSDFLTRNINKVNKASKRIAEGNYSERIIVQGKDEIRELADGFNQMAEKIEEKVKELSDTARQKEDFTANFAHEIKTPLTSVIGYADMLYQKELPREQVKNAAEYILNEGMRLETLSLKLMDLFVLDKQDFYLENMSVKEIFHNLTQDIKMMCARVNVTYHIELEEGSINIDFDFFKTLIVNLLDNAIKADCTDILFLGHTDIDTYQIQVKDNGKGIPPEELGRITEAFYMVDKSRARKQHGAGLGMALVSKIARLHGALLHLESDGKSGTAIVLTFAHGEVMNNEGKI